MKTYSANSQFKMLITLLVIVCAVFYLNSKFNFFEVKTNTSSNITETKTINKVAITNSKNEVKEVVVELATSEATRQLGLANRTYLNENNGMLFIFDTDVQNGFWMKSTLIPLDLIYIDTNKKIVDIKSKFLPCTTVDCQVYLTPSTYRYVLEVNAGWSEKNNVKVGDSVVITTS